MEYEPQTKRRREEEDYYSRTPNVITQSPLELVLRYEDAAKVMTPYVKWQYNFPVPIQGYSKVKLLNLMGYNNYSTNRLSMIGVQIDEFPKLVQSGSANSSVGPTFCVLNKSYSTTAFTSYEYDAKGEDPFLTLGPGRTFAQLTVSLYDGVGPLLTASGTPANYFTDMTLVFFN